MRRRAKQRGVTLTEMVIVVASVAVFIGIAMPALRTFFDSLGSSGPARPMISAALATARAIAAKEQRYAGVRFQTAVNPADPMNPLAAEQYMIYIVQDPELGAWFFRAVEGGEPMKLPTEMGIMDLVVVPGENRNIGNPVNPQQNISGLPAQLYVDDIARSAGANAADSFLDPANMMLVGTDMHMELRDMTTFSIVFSPAGKLVVTGVRVVNRGDALNPQRGALTDTDTEVNTHRRVSFDDIFNTKERVDFARIGMFYQDCYWKYQYNLYRDYDLGLGPEPSRTSFVIYEKDKFRAAYQNNQAWTQCLQYLKRIYINAYTGTMIGAD